MADFYEIIEQARKTGKIDKGLNEATKAAERGSAKLIVYAADVEPKELTQHLPLICEEKGIPCQEVDSKERLGVAAGITVKCGAVAVIDGGEAAKQIEAVKGGK